MVSGVAATRVSPGLVSAGMPILMVPPMINKLTSQSNTVFCAKVVIWRCLSHETLRKFKANAVFNTISTTTPPLSAVQISVDPSTITGATYTTAALSTANQTIAAAASPTIGTAYNINYAIPTAAPLLAMSAGTYTTNVVYTVTQP